jgi:hypothetical protein
MSVGLTIINNYGTILIDENYKNLALRQKTATATTTPLGRVTVPMSGMNTPMVALASAQYTGVKSIRSDLASFLIQGRDIGTDAVTAYVFDEPQASGVVAGLLVYNAAGQLTFDSGNKYARVVDVFGGAALADWQPLRSYAAGRNYAVVCLKRAYRKEVINNGGGNYDIRWYMSGTRVVNETVQGSMIRYKEDNVNAGSAPAQVTDYSAQFAVLDVTGY